jgi:hypothetical protein
MCSPSPLLRSGKLVNNQVENKKDKNIEVSETLQRDKGKQVINDTSTSADPSSETPYVPQVMEIKAPLRRISFKYQLDRLREHEQRSSRMYSMDSFKSYGLKQIR